MKFIICLLVLTYCCQTRAQEKKRVFLSCDALGAKNEDVRYYHPIEGEYEIAVKNHYLPNKKDQKSLSNFVLVNPHEYLKDSLTVIQANSLRHEIDLDELVYVNWKMGVDSLNNQAKLDSFENKACYTRDEKYAEVVQDYFVPFMMSRFEITNAEYREFVDWVKDSIMREKIYSNTNPTGNGEIEDDVIAQMLVHEDKYFDEEEMEWVDFDSSEPEKNREMFPFNYDFDWRKELEGDQYVPLISDMYLRPNERWYTRRQPDVSKLVYHYYSIDERQLPVMSDSLKNQNSAIRSHINKSRFVIKHEVPIYPDTLSWNEVKWLSPNQAMPNMYFWHPAYDHHPVVGLSYEQVLAYIDWRQKQLEKEYPELMSRYVLAVPNLQEIEWAVNSSIENNAAWVMGDEELVTDLSFGLEGDPKVKYEFLFKSGQARLTERVSAPMNPLNPKDVKLTSKYYKSHKEELSQNPHLSMRVSQNKLTNGIEFLSNNVSEWVDMDYAAYERLLDAYINYNCFANIDYCQYQRPLDANIIAKNDKDGKLIMGSNWYDERYESNLGINSAGIYPKRFADKDSSYATVGFRLVLRSIYR